MSSHHVVRENQEAAVFVNDLNILNMDALQNTFQWSPIIVADENTFLDLVELGYKIDCIICQQIFAESHNDFIRNQHPIEVIFINDPSEIIQVGINFLIGRNSLYIYLFSSISIDDYFKLSIRNENVSVTLFNNGYHYSVLKDGFKKWFALGDRVILTTIDHNNSIKIELPDGSFEIITGNKTINYNFNVEGIHKFQLAKPIIIGWKN